MYSIVILYMYILQNDYICGFCGIWDKKETTNMIKQGGLMAFEQRKRNWESLTLLNTIFRNLFIKAHGGTIHDA